MRKLIAIILTFMLLLSLIPVETTAKAAELGDKPFYCVSMCGSPTQYPYYYSQPCTYTYPITPDTEWPRVFLSDAEGEFEIAEKMANEFDDRPAGTRYFQLELVHKYYRSRVDKVVFFDECVATVNEWMTGFVEEFYHLGGKIDGIITDLEYIESDGYYIRDYYNGTRGKTENKNVYREIVEDPRYATQIRPLLEEFGFVFYEGTDVEKGHCEIFCVHSTAGTTGHEKCYSIWNHVMEVIKRDAITKAVLVPLQKYYPDATVSDYQSITLDTWYEAIQNFGDKVAYNSIGAGNLSDINTYAGRPQASFFKAGYRPPSYNKATFDPTAFNVTNYDINLFKNMYASTDDRRIDAWIAHYYYVLDPQASGWGSTYCCTPYYSEILYHIGLLNPEVFLGYIIKTEVEANGGTPDDVAHIVSDIMVELTRVAGASDREPILIPETAAYWNASYILSGMYAAGRNIWRITPDTSVVSVEDFKVEGTDPTFSVNGLTVTFPQGKIVENGDIYIAGNCGYWVETPKGVNPVVTADPDRISKYPSFLADFEEYEVGAKFTNGLAKPANSWRVGGSATIQAFGDGKALALEGTTVIENIKLPANISAGDDYAMRQIWETQVILPDGLDARAELKLFSTQETDGGLKIADGKVYYDEKGTYKQLEGVSLSANTAYTVRRELDFWDFDYFYSDYSVYDATGNLLGQVKNVPMRAFNLPVSSIAMYTLNLNAPVLIDDYKLYPAGVATVLELYDAEMGEKITDLSTVRTKNTAYRLSWMNATTDKMKAIIYNAQTGETIQTIDMAPGMDGVNTAIVEITADKPVTLAVKTEMEGNSDGATGSGDQGGNTPGGNQGGNNQDDTNQGTNNQNNANQGSANQGGNADHDKKSSAAVIIGAVVAVLVITVAVVVVLVRKKKHTTEPTDNQ